MLKELFSLVFRMETFQQTLGKGQEDITKPL